jgi:hypothetical protein
MAHFVQIHISGIDEIKMFVVLILDDLFVFHQLCVDAAEDLTILLNELLFVRSFWKLTYQVSFYCLASSREPSNLHREI